jgi:O-antigen/teichoic acid export membrane protein
MEDSRTKKSFKNIIMGFSYQFVTLIFGFISRTVFINTLGVDLLGVNGLFMDVLILLSIADLGLNTAMVYSLYKPIAEQDTVKVSALIHFYKKIYKIIAIAVTVIGICILPFLDFIVNTDQEIPLLKVYYLFSLASVVISYLFVYKTSIIIADQKNYLVTRISLVTSFISTIIQIISLIIFKNYIVYLIINLIFNFLNNYIASRKATQLYPYLQQKQELEEQDKKDIFTNIKSIFLYKVSGLLLNATDNILISILIGTTVVGYYSNYLMVTNRIVAIIQIFFGALTASIGNIIVKETSEKRYEVFNATQSVSFIICGIIVTSFSVLINDLIQVWIGKEFMFDNKFVLVISLNMYLACVLQPLWTYREATGLYVKTKYVMLVAAVVNLILSVILGQVLGVSGILLASAISRLTTYFWYEPLLLFKNYFSKPVWRYFISIIINVVITGGAIVSFNKVLAGIVVTSWALLIVKGVICGIGTSVIFLLLYSRTEGFKIIIKKFKLIK